MTEEIITARFAVGIVLDQGDDDWAGPAEAQATHVGPALRLAYEPVPAEPAQPVAGGEVRPAGRRSHTRIYLCTKLAGDVDAGRLLSWCVGWSPKATLRLRGRQGLWNANARKQILAGTGLTPKKWRRVASIAAENGIEFVLGKHRGKNAIFTRPTETLLRYLRGELNLCDARQILAEGHFRGHFRGHFSIPSTPLIPSNQGTRNSASPVEGRGGQPTRDAAPPQPVAPVRQDSTVLPLVRRGAARAANAELVAQAQAVLDRGLSPMARRAELLVVLPELSPAVPRVVHPSKIPGRGEYWHEQSPEVLAGQYRRYTTYHGNAAKKQGIRPASRTSFVLTDADLTPEARAAAEAAKGFEMKPWVEPPDPYLAQAPGTPPPPPVDRV